MRDRDESPSADLSDEPVVPERLATPVMPPPLVRNRECHEALAAIEREVAALLGARTRNLPRLFADLRAKL